MLEQFGGGRPLVDVDFETSVEEARQLGRQLRLVLHLRLAIGRNQVECTQWGLVQIWWFPVYHLDHHDAEAPDVNLVTVLLPE